MNSKYVRFSYLLATVWLMGLIYMVNWFLSLDEDKGLPEVFTNAHYSWNAQTPPRGGPEPRLDGFVRGSRNTTLNLPPMPPSRETDIVRNSNVKSHSDIKSCFWPGPRGRIGFYTTDPDDYAHEREMADLGRTSSMSWFQLPEAGQLVLKGQYPHARMMSLTLYDEKGQVLDRTYDAALEPDGGSSNPYRRGVRRDIGLRNYTVFVVNGKAPAANRPYNTLYTQRKPGEAIGIDLRIFVPDQDRDWTGGVGLPKISLKVGEQVLDEDSACIRTLTEMRGLGLPNQGLSPKVWLALNELPWKEVSKSPADDFDFLGMQRFFNMEFSTLQSYVPLLELIQEYIPSLVKPEIRPQPFSDPYTQFGYGLINQLYAKVFVVQGRLPNTPRTHDQTTLPMSDNYEMRYWSLCTSSFPVTGLTTDCLHDENLRTLLDAQNQYTVVVSRLSERPNNATPRCGVQWLELGHGDGVPSGSRSYSALINRFTLSDPEFKRGWSDVDAPKRERQAMGAYRPFVVNLTDKERFELLGCPVSAVVIERLKTGKDRSWRRR
ncbi:MAG: hypothetical protein RLZZ123_276 [Pseudomonadota bacterium]|jgi:hypothetical protein